MSGARPTLSAPVVLTLVTLTVLTGCGGGSNDPGSPILSRTVVEPLMEVIEIEGATITSLVVEEEQGHGWLWVGCHRGQPDSDENGPFIHFTESHHFNPESRPNRPWGDAPDVRGVGSRGGPDSFGVTLDWTWNEATRTFELEGLGLFDLLANSDFFTLKMKVGDSVVDHQYDLRAARDSTIWEMIGRCRSS